MEPTIELRLFATLERYLPETAHAYRIQEGSRVRDMVVRLGIPLEKAKLIFVNGRKADLETVLYGGERVGIFPPVGGG